MIPNTTTYEAGFKAQLFTIVLVSSSLIFGIWSITKLIINLSKTEENQKKLNIFYQKCINLINYYLDDFKYLEEGIKIFQKRFRHKQVYESVAVEGGLFEPKVENEYKTIYCQEYYQKVLEKQKANKDVFSEVTIILTLSSGVTPNYLPRYPWYWDGVELFNGIQPNPKPVYNPEYLSPEYVPKVRFMENNVQKPYETTNVKSEQEAESNGQYLMTSSSQSSDEEKMLSTLLLCKNNSLQNSTPVTTPLIVQIDEEADDNSEIEINRNVVPNHDEIQNEINNFNGFEISIEKGENKNSLVSISLENIVSPIKESETKNNFETPYTINHQLKPSKSTSHLKNEKEKPSTPVRKSKSLPNLNSNKNSSKSQQKQKFMKKLKHKKQQPKIIYPSIPVNPDLSFVPLYKKNINESKIQSRVKHSDMENTYKRLKAEMQQKLK